MEKAERERSLAAARELLKGEIEALTQRAVRAEKEAKRLRDIIDSGEYE